MAEKKLLSESIKEPRFVFLVVLAFMAGFAIGYNLPKTRDLGVVTRIMPEGAAQAIERNQSAK